MADLRAKDSGPRILGRYAIYDAIASGGMATVHYGRLLGPVGFSRTVAIKRLHPQYAQDPEFVTMFLDEARLAGRIRHPNVVATLDVVASANEIFLVMDYVHGESLARIIREVTSRDQTVPLPIALRIATDALQGLHAAHEARDERGIPLNIVHRDISPQNILLGVDGVARLVDFGVAKAAGRGQTTREGQIKGKLGYMAPEQLKGGKVTRQTDVHAFATVLWEMLTGTRLFVGESEADTVARVMRHSIPPVTDYVADMPPEVDAVLRRGLAEELGDRYGTAREMCVALEACGVIAPTMHVADWVQREAHDLLDRRAEVVSSIESNEDASAVTEISKDGGASAVSAKDWVASLSSPDVPKGATGGPSSGRIPPGGAPDNSVSVILEDVVLPPRSRSWAGLTGLGVGVALVALAIGAWSNRTPGHAPAGSGQPAAQATDALPSATTTGGAVPVPALASAASAAPVAGAVSAAAEASTPAPLPPVRSSRPPVAKTAHVPGAPPPRHDVFDTRE